ncbi:MAG: hypothetical protein ACRERD_29730 [Candidatus Binatia bacterium]
MDRKADVFLLHRERQDLGVGFDLYNPIDFDRPPAGHGGLRGGCLWHKGPGEEQNQQQLGPPLEVMRTEENKPRRNWGPLLPR